MPAGVSFRRSESRYNPHCHGSGIDSKESRFACPCSWSGRRGRDRVFPSLSLGDDATSVRAIVCTDFADRPGGRADFVGHGDRESTRDRTDEKRGPVQCRASAVDRFPCRLSSRVRGGYDAHRRSLRSLAPFHSARRVHSPNRISVFSWDRGVSADRTKNKMRCVRVASATRDPQRGRDDGRPLSECHHADNELCFVSLEEHDEVTAENPGHAK